MAFCLLTDETALGALPWLLYVDRLFSTYAVHLLAGWLLYGTLISYSTVDKCWMVDAEAWRPLSLSDAAAVYAGADLTRRAGPRDSLTCTAYAMTYRDWHSRPGQLSATLAWVVDSFSALTAGCQIAHRPAAHGQ